MDATGSSPLIVEISTSTASVNSGVFLASGGGELDLVQGLLSGSGQVEAQSGSLVEFGKAFHFTDVAGLVKADAGGEVDIGALTHNTGAFNNTGGIVEAVGGTVLIGKGALSNLVGGTLTGGAWRAYGAGATLTFQDGFSTLAATLGLDAGSVVQDGTGTLESQLAAIASAGELDVLGARNYTTSNALILDGTLQISSGTFTSGLITASSTSTISGPGTIASSLTDAGTVTSSNSLATTFTGANDTFSGVLGGSGIIRFAGGTDTLASGAVLSSRTVSIAGAAVKLAANVTDSGAFSMSAGSLALSGASSYGLTLKGGGNIFSGGTLTGSGTLLVTGGTTIATLKIGGAVQFRDSSTVNQTGNVTLGDSTNGKAQIVVLAGYKWQIAGDVGVTAGSTAAAVNVAGTLVKTAGSTTSSIIAPAITNTASSAGTIEVKTGTLELAGELTGKLTLDVDVGTTLILDKAAASGSVASFTGSSGTLQLNDAQDFQGSVSGFGAGRTLDLRSILDSTAGPATLTYGGNATAGTLTVSDGTRTAHLALQGNYTASSFHLASDSHGGSAITLV